MSTKGKLIRPTVRFGEQQYQLIQAKLRERDVTFQRYCLELICSDLGVPVTEFEKLEDEQGQLSLFSENAENQEASTPGVQGVATPLASTLSGDEDGLKQGR